MNGGEGLDEFKGLEKGVEDVVLFMDQVCDEIRCGSKDFLGGIVYFFKVICVMFI